MTRLATRRCYVAALVSYHTAHRRAHKKQERERWPCANNRRPCAHATVLLLLAMTGCATPDRDVYVPSVASPPKEPLNREARVARAKALEFPTEYVAPPGDPMSHHAAALARVVCAGAFITGLDANFVVANAGAIPPFDVRKDLGKPVVHASKQDG